MGNYNKRIVDKDCVAQCEDCDGYYYWDGYSRKDNVSRWARTHANKTGHIVKLIDAITRVYRKEE